MKKTIALILVAFLPLLVGCGLSEKKVTETPDSTHIVLTDGTYTVDTDASMLYWEAYKPIGGHMGGAFSSKVAS